MGMQCAHVNRTTLVRHPIVVPNVWSVRNVQTIAPASIVNALIHVRTHAALALYAMQRIIIRFALVHLAIPAIHSHNAPELVSVIRLRDFKKPENTQLRPAHLHPLSNRS